MASPGHHARHLDRTDGALADPDDQVTTVQQIARGRNSPDIRHFPVVEVRAALGDSPPGRRLARRDSRLGYQVGDGPWSGAWTGGARWRTVEAGVAPGDEHKRGPSHLEDRTHELERGA